MSDLDSVLNFKIVEASESSLGSAIAFRSSGNDALVPEKHPRLGELVWFRINLDVQCIWSSTNLLYRGLGEIKADSAYIRRIHTGSQSGSLI
ncbi:hypothetical protein MVEN_00008400 [Mycena venus]|uniref:Uncharacterized protein n=1 Tax=Mycena venus TaxID=2733690 RepID=A0A8H6Z2R0_9AGAR|nr:hypothetical protein MVEN_00008400 [Mycena venus]